MEMLNNWDIGPYLAPSANDFVHWRMYHSYFAHAQSGLFPPQTHIGKLHCQKKRYESCHWGGTFSKRYTFVPKGTNMYHQGTNMHPLGPKVYHEGTNMHPLGTKVYQEGANMHPLGTKCTFWKCTAPVTAFVPFFLRVLEEFKLLYSIYTVYIYIYIFFLQCR